MFMSWLTRIWNRKRSNLHKFTDEERELADQIRKDRLEQRRISLQYEKEIKELERDRQRYKLLNDIKEVKGINGSENNDLAVLMQIFQVAMANRQPKTEKPKITNERTFTDEQITAFISTIPKNLIQKYKNKSMVELTEIIKDKEPKATDKDCSRAYEILQNDF
jgi:hypothetical protein